MNAKMDTDYKMVLVGNAPTILLIVHNAQQMLLYVLIVLINIGLKHPIIHVRDAIILIVFDAIQTYIVVQCVKLLVGV